MTTRKRLFKAVKDFERLNELNSRLCGEMMEATLQMLTRRTMTTIEWKRLKRKGKYAQRKRMSQN